MTLTFRDHRPKQYNPWEADMTLCIAAHCLWDGKPAIVSAFDERVETDAASANSEIKYAPINKYWGGLLAGPVSQARELIDLYKEQLANAADITSTNVIEQLRIPLRVMKQRLADEVTSHLLCMTHKEFMENGKASTSDEMYRHVETQIASQQIEAQLILIGFIDAQPHIFVSQGSNIVRVTTFATIGSGSSIAQATLFQRNQAHYCDISRTLYAVYEAMLLGRNAPGVGPCRLMTIMVPSADGFSVGVMNTEGSPLEKYFVSYGPKPVPPKLPGFTLTAKSLDPVSNVWVTLPDKTEPL